MRIQEYLNYRRDLLEGAKDGDGFVQQSSLLSAVLPFLVDARLLDSEDWNDAYFAYPSDNLKLNGYSVNESSERLQLFIVDEDSINLSAEESDILVSTKIYYENQFKRATKLLSRAIKGGLNDELQDADPIRPLVYKLSSSSGVDQFDVVEIFLVTATATIETRGNTPQPRRIDFEDEVMSVSFTKNREKAKKEILIVKKLIDLNFLFDVLVSQGNRKPLVIDFEDLFKSNIEVIRAAAEENFESYLCVLPATVLAELYRIHSSRLLEKNVRSFLQFKKEANKGIRETIRISPEKFIAFNNGITVTATDKEIIDVNGKTYIKSLTDFQIVNGGQTTAAIYFTRKDGFSIDKVKVMAKINVALDVTEEGLDNLISDISRYSNSQTKVSNVDLGSRNPQLNKLKSLSESIVTPSGRKWFFEKSRGEFSTKLRIAGSNSTRIEKEYPRNFRFTKEQLGKYFTAWGDQPYVVKKGGDKVFRYFLEEITGQGKSKRPSNINRAFYEKLISKIILFTELEKIYGQGKNAIGQIRSAVIPYSLSIVYIYTDGAKENKEFDLSKIWRNEKLDENLITFFTALLELMNNLIKQYSESDDLGEYSKNKKLWDNISSSKEIKQFMSSSLASEVLRKYSVPVSLQDDVSPDVNFELVKRSIEIHSRGIEFYSRLKAKRPNLSKFEDRKIDQILSAIAKQDDLDETTLLFENDLMTDIRKNTPELFDELNGAQNLDLEQTLKFIIVKYNQALEKGVEISDFFQSVVKRGTEEDSKNISVYKRIGSLLATGAAPKVKDIYHACGYFSSSSTQQALVVPESEAKINLALLRKMVEWDSRMKILSNGERSYLADLAYELKPLNSFHKQNALRHLKTLLASGFKVK